MASGVSFIRQVGSSTKKRNLKCVMQRRPTLLPMDVERRLDSDKEEISNVTKANNLPECNSRTVPAYIGSMNRGWMPLNYREFFP
jgi:hypothetical protein